MRGYLIDPKACEIRPVEWAGEQELFDLCGGAFQELRPWGADRPFGSLYVRDEQQTGAGQFRLSSSLWDKTLSGRGVVVDAGGKGPVLAEALGVEIQFCEGRDYFDCAANYESDRKWRAEEEARRATNPWQQVYEGASRMKVPGGWLYQVVFLESMALAFVPDAGVGFQE